MKIYTISDDAKVISHQVETATIMSVKVDINTLLHSGSEMVVRHWIELLDETPSVQCR